MILLLEYRVQFLQPGQGLWMIQISNWEGRTCLVS